MPTNTKDSAGPQKAGRLKRLVRALQRLERDWPTGVILYANNGTLHLMAGHPEAGGESLASFAIPCDGGQVEIP